MAILNFIKPDKVIMLDSSKTKGVFEFRPLEPGYLSFVRSSRGTELR